MLVVKCEGKPQKIYKYLCSKCDSEVWFEFLPVEEYCECPCCGARDLVLIDTDDNVLNK